MKSESTTDCKLDELLEKFVKRLNIKHGYTETEYQELVDAVNVCFDTEKINEIAIRMFTNEYSLVPIELGVLILRRYVQSYPDAERAKAFLYQYLWFHGKEYENDEEGIKLLEGIKNLELMSVPWEGEPKQG